MIELRIVYNSNVRRTGPRVIDWTDIARGQQCVSCHHVIGDEPTGQIENDEWGPTQILMLGANLVGQQVREASGFTYLARCMYIHRACAENLTTTEIDDLARNTLDALLGHAHS